MELGFLSLSRSTWASYTVAFADGSHFIDGEVEAQEVTCTRVSKLQIIFATSDSTP